MTTILRFILFFLLAPAFAIVTQAAGAVQDDFRVVDAGHLTEMVVLDSVEGGICNYDASGALLQQRSSLDEKAADEDDQGGSLEIETSGAARPVYCFSAQFVATNNTQRVFWSGGRAAEDSARTFANANRGVIIGDTTAGRALAQATEGVPWSQARPQWLSLSEDFARGASGEVNVFQNARGLSLDSIWKNEYQILQQNPNVTGIKFNVVMPDGSITPVP